MFSLINLHRRAAAAVVIALALGSSAFAADKTLYDRLGGKPALEAVVGELWAITSKDKRINKYFANTKPEAFAGQLVDFLCEASGGPCKYKGQDMVAAHTGMHLKNKDFDALAQNVVKALDKFKVPAREKKEVMTMLGSLRSSIVNH
ncbi:group 1 truncated hemoglobin [Alsobacter sp. SYSU M60028]|uniref:Group 1 truncated hemoglobin n=1 Tax=Alsobacter ponti TaxID=2962936 RepID=A0ABT1L6V9_9HYPH|nr:group 1 truncated hemoglobin [Alsobacter ponti]MCP8937044.1 group 1 truncated hemoglobin [Alsobacter ponti]